MTDRPHRQTTDRNNMPPPSSLPRTPVKSQFFKKGWIWWGLAIVLVVIILSKCSAGSHWMTVKEAQAELLADLNAKLEQPDCPINKYVEDAHLTVTVKSSRVVRCDIETIDGSDRIGRDLENVKFISILMRFNWEGFIDEGYTDVKAEFDVPNERIVNFGIDYTTALVNLEDPTFWANMGAFIGTCLLL